MDTKILVAIPIAIITLVIGISILDQIMADVTYPASGNDSIQLANGTWNTTTYDDIVTNLNVYNATATLTLNTDYQQNLTDGGVRCISGAACNVKTFNVEYNYNDDKYLSGATSRTVATYLVPIMIIGALALAGYFAYMRVA